MGRIKVTNPHVKYELILAYFNPMNVWDVNCRKYVNDGPIKSTHFVILNGMFNRRASTSIMATSKPALNATTGEFPRNAISSGITTDMGGLPSRIFSLSPWIASAPSCSSWDEFILSRPGVRAVVERNRTSQFLQRLPNLIV